MFVKNVNTAHQTKIRTTKSAFSKCPNHLFLFTVDVIHVLLYAKREYCPPQKKKIAFYKHYLPFLNALLFGELASFVKAMPEVL